MSNHDVPRNRQPKKIPHNRQYKNAGQQWQTTSDRPKKSRFDVLPLRISSLVRTYSHKHTTTNRHTQQITVHSFISRQDPATQSDTQIGHLSNLLGTDIASQFSTLAPTTKLSQLHRWLKTKGDGKNRSHSQRITAALSGVTCWRTVATKGS